jgi:hypothetical protein
MTLIRKRLPVIAVIGKAKIKVKFQGHARNHRRELPVDRRNRRNKNHTAEGGGATRAFKMPTSHPPVAFYSGEKG